MAFEISQISPPFLAPQSADVSSIPLDQQTKDNVEIDIGEEIQDKKGSLLLPPTYCIYRVPPMIRKLRKHVYTPMAVSVGPFHYGDKRLQDMEKHKQVLFKRFKEKVDQATVNKMFSFVKQSEPKVRSCYSENIILKEEKLVNLVLVDAIFIIILFTGEMNDAKLSQTYLRETMANDLVLLENQLPFLVIEKLFNIAFPYHLQGDLPAFYSDFPSFLDLTFCFFAYFNKQNLKPNSNDRIQHFTDLLRLFYLPRKEPEKDQLENLPRKEPEKDQLDAEDHLLNSAIELEKADLPNDRIKHFTDLLRCSCLPRKEPKMDQPEDDEVYLLYSANELEQAGVKFKKVTTKCLLDLKFSKPNLEIPQIFVDDDTELLFRNMIALEHCHYRSESHVTGYATMMDCLINTNKDVEILIHNKIICNLLGDTNEVAELFNGLCKNTCQNLSSEYLAICRGLNKFYRNPWHKMKANLALDYCNTPWKTMGTAVGIIVIILTIIQTIFSVLQVVMS